MSLVIDCSIALAWYFEDETAEASDAVLKQVIKEGAVAPSLWRFEVANGLQMAVRRKRINAAYRDRILANLAGLNVAVDSESDAHAWSATVQLAERHSLTVYDAAYLELAKRRGYTLATLDVALIKAGRAELVPVVGT